MLIIRHLPGFRGSAKSAEWISRLEHKRGEGNNQTKDNGLSRSIWHQGIITQAFMTKKVIGNKTTADQKLGNSHWPQRIAENARSMKLHIQCWSSWDEKEQGLGTPFSAPSLWDSHCITALWRPQNHHRETCSLFFEAGYPNSLACRTCHSHSVCYHSKENLCEIQD